MHIWQCVLSLSEFSYILPRGKLITFTKRFAMRHVVFLFSLVCMAILNATAQTDVTETYIVNSAFDDDTMVDDAPTGWSLDFSTSGVQSKIIKVGKGGGLIASGQNHWQIQKSSGSTSGKAFQIISNLPTGRYKLTAVVVPVFTGEIKFYLGNDSVNVITKQNQTYEIETLAIGGEIEFGFFFNTTNSTTLDVDDFKFYQLEMEESDYSAALDEWHSLCVADTVETDRQTWYNTDEFAEAFNVYELAKSGEKGMQEAIDQLRSTHEKYQSITVAYKALKAESDSLYNTIKGTKFAAIDSVSSVLSTITSYYTEDEDHYSWVDEQLAFIRSAEEAYNLYLRLQKLGSLARNQYNATEYDGKSVFADALSKAYKTQVGASTPEEFQQAIEALEKAQDEYLANRPSEWVTIQNGQLWKTDTNATVQAHAPGFVRVGDIWYMVGENRARQWSPDVNLYSSTDLVHWKFEKNIIQNYVSTPDLGWTRMIERPKLLYNPKTEKFVVWCHYESSNYGASEAACFECDSVNGAYTYIWGGRPLNIKSRDCNVFQDTDGTAYFISTTEENQHLGLFRLDENYREAVEHTRLFASQQREAPAIIRIGNRYFMFNSACSGWDPNQCKMAYSTKLESGWTSLANIGNDIAFDTQAAAILEIKGTKTTTYLYVGDRWQDSGLPESKTIIFPIEFSGTRCTFTYHERFDINFVTGEWRETPVDDYFADKTEWTVLNYSSEETTSDKAYADNAIDGDITTKWHSKYSGTVASAPHYITIDMGKEISIQGFLATPRMDSSSRGLIRNYQFQVSKDGVNWETVSSGNWLLYCTEMSFAHKECRYIKLICTEGTYASLAELDVVLYHDPTAIDEIKSDEKSDKIIARRRYYSVDGRQIPEPSEGVFIEKTEFTDGTSKSVKKLRR